MARRLNPIQFSLETRTILSTSGCRFLPPSLSLLFNIHDFHQMALVLVTRLCPVFRLNVPL